MTDSLVDGTAEIQRAVGLLGGATVFRHPLREWLDVHEIPLLELPGAAFGHLVDSLIVTKSWGAISEALGMSRRTFQRRLNTPEKVLRREQSDRLWAFAYIVAKATSALRSQKRAENWMATPCASVRGLRPVDLSGSPVGIDIVEYLLERTGYGWPAWRGSAAGIATPRPYLARWPHDPLSTSMRDGGLASIPAGP